MYKMSFSKAFFRFYNKMVLLKETFQKLNGTIEKNVKNPMQLFLLFSFLYLKLFKGNSHKTLLRFVRINSLHLKRVKSEEKADKVSAFQTLYFFVLVWINVSKCLLFQKPFFRFHKKMVLINQNKLFLKTKSHNCDFVEKLEYNCLFFVSFSKIIQS